jgi:hypothetical protein
MICGFSMSETNSYSLSLDPNVFLVSLFANCHLLLYQGAIRQISGISGNILMFLYATRSF